MMLRHASVFSQLLAIVDRNKFSRLVKQTNAEKGDADGRLPPAHGMERP